MVNGNVSIENAHILPGDFRNFEGREGAYNKAGDRSFCISLDFDLADAMRADGWNIKQLRPRNPEDDPTPYIQVKVNFDGRIPPNIVMISGNKKTKLDSETVNMLDWAEIEKADVILRPYNWEVNGHKGVKAYLKTLYVTVAKDEFEDKYNFEEAPF